LQNQSESAFTQNSRLNNCCRRESYRIRLYPCFPWYRQATVKPRQLGTFCGSRESKRGCYSVYFCAILSYSCKPPITNLFLIHSFLLRSGCGLVSKRG